MDDDGCGGGGGGVDGGVDVSVIVTGYQMKTACLRERIDVSNIAMAITMNALPHRYT